MPHMFLFSLPLVESATDRHLFSLNSGLKISNIFYLRNICHIYQLFPLWSSRIYLSPAISGDAQAPIPIRGLAAVHGHLTRAVDRHHFYIGPARCLNVRELRHTHLLQNISPITASCRFPGLHDTARLFNTPVCRGLPFSYHVYWSLVTAKSPLPKT